MHNTLGNYREKMALDVQKHGRTSSSMKFVTTCVQNEKCMFVKRAICKSTKEKQNLDNKVMTPNMDDDSVDCTQTAFKFNFQITE
ncbi:hypothetical protein WN55_08057 [Dufourea novaeangliae]|uniref:Uncharacterized protein n=2 Tax=Dufourea novaeangliae TaxID=178035 RepID=A0A154P716_DUFNO|nr:hypothetical protein WN55_08057 [Dufourea novaeangliae]